jgi:hypothetical protein
VHLLATAALGVRIQTSSKNTKWATHSSPPKKCTTKILEQDERRGCVIFTSYQGKNVIITLTLRWKKNQAIRTESSELKIGEKHRPSDAQTSMEDNKYLPRRYNTHYRTYKMQ